MVFQPFLQNWLRGLATEKVRQIVVQAAQEKLAETRSPDSSGKAPAPCDAGVVFALETESGGLEDLLAETTSYQGHGFVAQLGTLAGRRLAVVRSGAGRAQAAAATDALLTGHRPGWVISAGFAGGLSPSLKRYDLVVADRLIDSEGHVLPVELPIERPSPQHRSLRVGTLLTMDRIVRRPEEKRRLGQVHGALAVDMETYAVAEVCLRHRVPFVSVRVVIDAVDDQLPADLDRMLKQKTQAARFGAALGTLFNRPRSLKDLMELRERALRATDRLAKFLTSLVAVLCPASDS